MNRKQRRKQKLKTQTRSPEERFAKALAFYEKGRLTESRRAIVELLKVFPQAADLYRLKGMISATEGDFEEAEKTMRAGLSADPKNAALADALGTVLMYSKKTGDAVVAFRRALINEPNAPGTLNNLGNALMAEGDLNGAVEAYRESLRVRPGDAKTEGNLGNVLKRQNHFQQAEAAYRRSLSADPADPETHIDLGDLMFRDRRWQEAIDCFDMAIDRGTSNPDAHAFKARAMINLGRLDEAEAEVRAGLRINPDHPYSRQTLSILHFYAERWFEGWSEYESRWDLSVSPMRPFPQPLWSGEPCAEKTVLVWGEQGLGDEIMYASMVPDMANACGHVVLEADPRMVPILQRSFPDMECIPRENPPAKRALEKDVAFQVPMANLGTQFRRSEADFPGGQPYLRADAGQVDALRARYARGGVKTVGLAWFSKRAGSGVDKSMPLQMMAPLVDIEGIRFVDLQYGDTLAERSEFEKRTGAELIHDDEIDQMVDLDSFAAQVAAMDLVISVSNTTVHMAGGLGIPTWLMVNAWPDRRWMLERDDCPWYESVRVFRQTEPGDWSPVISAVREDLLKLVSE